VSRSGWFRRQESLLASSGASPAKRIWRLFPAAPRPGASSGRRLGRSAVLTASSAALVMGAGVAVVAFAPPGSHGSPVTRTVRSADSRPEQPAAPLQVVSVTPAAGARGVNGAAPIRVQFSAPLAASSPMPQLKPQIAGGWRVQGSSAVFTAAAGYFPNTRVTVKIPAGPSGVVSATGATAGGGNLASPVTESFTTGSFKTLRLQQLLAQLGYLPMTWTAASGPAISPGNANAQLSAAYNPPAGTFTWQGSYPSTLKKQWRAGSGNMLDVGAIRAFESVHGLTMDGSAGSAVWSRLFTAVAKGQRNPNGYTYALASQYSPESLKIWHNGRLVMNTPANTGIGAAPTVDGTFPVYLRYYYQIMKGTNPDGSKYADPVYYVAYFNGGDAVHYFSRGSYGWYQSLGCVELPWDQAKKAWPYLTYGSLVTVTGPVA
jgi:peptidoglycan hydrolase-like protein with peptidoglycan-binding domain